MDDLFNTPLRYDLWNAVPLPVVNMDTDDIFNTAFYGVESRTEKLLIVDDEHRHGENNPREFLMTPRCSSPKPSRIRPPLFSRNDPIERNSFLEFGRKLRDTESTHSPMETYVEQRIISGNMVMPKRQSGPREMTERLPVVHHEGRSELEEFKFRFEKAMERIRGSAVNHHPDIDCGKNEPVMLMRDRFSERRREVEERKYRIETAMQMITKLPERITSEFDKFITKVESVMKENEA